MLLTNWLSGIHRQFQLRNRGMLRQRRVSPLSQIAAQIALLEQRQLLSSTAAGPETLLNGTIVGDQRFSPQSDRTLAVAADGTVIAAWTAPGADGVSTNIVARRMDANGNLLGNEVLVNTTTSGTRGNAVVGVAGGTTGGKFVVAWESTGNPQDTSAGGVFARVFSSSGAPLTGEFRVNGTTSGIQQDPSIVWVSADAFVVGWSGAGQGDNQNAFARVFQSSGSPLTNEIRVNDVLAGAQQEAVVLALPGGGFQAAWSGAGTGDANAIYARRFDSAGNPLGASFRVNTASAATEQQPAMARDGTNQVVVVWQATGNSLDGSGSGIVARRFDLNGTALGPEFLVSQTTTGTQADPSVAFLSDGRLVVAWQGAGAADGDGVYVREFNADGTTADEERLANATIAGTQGRPTVRAQGTDYLVAWDGNFAGGAGGASDTQGIVLQRFTQSAQVSVEFTITNDWGSGFGASVTIRNNSSKAINGWKLEFDFPYSINDIWNADIVSHVGNHYVLQNKSYNATIAAGGSVSFGFNGSPGNVTSKPTNYILNGVRLGAAAELPSLSIADVSIQEGDSGTKTASFTVTLSQASTKTVTVAYATRNGSATAGTDYAAASGTLTFSPGQTSKSVLVTVNGDVTVENDEDFFVTLSSPGNATLSDAEARGVVRNDDQPAAVIPNITITDAQVAEGNAQSVATGYFHTQGNQIVDANNRPIRLAGVNWFGMETSTYAPHGLWTRGYKEMMDQMKQLGFNVIRLPFSNQLFDTGSTPNGIDFNKNPDLQGLTGLQIMDKIVSYAGQLGLRIILDHHRSGAGDGAEGSGLWYTSAYPESRWIADWTMLATRYANNPTVIGADLHNEPHGPALWGDGSATDWRLAAERAGNAVLGANPNLLILVEGVEYGKSGNYWWGGNLSNAGDYPVRLNTAGRLVYSPHDYPASIYQQQWFSDPNYPNNLPAVWDASWGYLFRQGTAPILLGEFGTRLATTSDQQWLDKMITYIQGDLNGDGASDLSGGQLGISWTWWSWNPNSGDTGGILQDDWRTVNQVKVDKLKPVEFSLDSAGAVAMFTVTLSQPTTNTVTVAYTTVNGTAIAGEDYAASSGTLTFNPGETQKTIWISLVGDTTREPDETFFVRLSNPLKGVITDGEGLGTILNDDA
ncbi:MAG: cellulase family glycosylhydrolase [Planctomycetales bacterium]